MYQKDTCGKLLHTAMGVFRRGKREKDEKVTYICNRRLSSKTENEKTERFIKTYIYESVS